MNGVVGLRHLIYKRIGSFLESNTIAGDSPLQVSLYLDSSILSSTEHEKFCVNQRGPSRKAKYSLETDSEPVL